MAIKIKCLFALTAIYLITISSSCNKLGCANTVYNFKISAKAYPDIDSIHINDTLWLEINAPVNLTDITSNKIIDYSGAANLGSALSFVKFTGGSVSDPGGVYSANSFMYFVVEGKQVINSFTDGIREFLFLENNNLYKFKVGVIPQQTGVFSIGFSNAANVYRKSDNCTKAGFRINFENTNQHLYFLEMNRPGYVITGPDLTSTYYFKVY